MAKDNGDPSDLDRLKYYMPRLPAGALERDDSILCEKCQDKGVIFKSKGEYEYVYRCTCSASRPYWLQNYPKIDQEGEVEDTRPQVTPPKPLQEAISKVLEVFPGTEVSCVKRVDKPTIGEAKADPEEGDITPKEGNDYITFK